jgi:hypothetical protein
VLYREPVSGTKKHLVGKFGVGQIKGAGSLVSCCKCKHTILCLSDSNALTIPLVSNLMSTITLLPNIRVSASKQQVIQRCSQTLSWRRHQHLPQWPMLSLAPRRAGQWLQHPCEATRVLKQAKSAHTHRYYLPVRLYRTEDTTCYVLHSKAPRWRGIQDFSQVREEHPIDATT